MNNHQQDIFSNESRDYYVYRLIDPQLDIHSMSEKE
jgi:hypothetical protein